MFLKMCSPEERPYKKSREQEPVGHEQECAAHGTRILAYFP